MVALPPGTVSKRLVAPESCGLLAMKSFGLHWTTYVECTRTDSRGRGVVSILRACQSPGSHRKGKLTYTQSIASQICLEIQVQSLVVTLAERRLHLDLGTSDISRPSCVDGSGDSLKHELDVVWSYPQHQLSGDIQRFRSNSPKFSFNTAN